MAISFPHSTRVLRNDGLVPTAVALTIAGLILTLWGTWFVLARVPLTVTCLSAEVAADGILLAHCPPEQIGRLSQGAPAVAVVAGTSGRKTVAAVVLRVPDRYTGGLDPTTVEVYPFVDKPLAPGTSAEVRVEVEEVSPLELALRGGSGQAAQP